MERPSVQETAINRCKPFIFHLRALVGAVSAVTDGWPNGYTTKRAKMDRETVIRKFENVKLWQRGGVRAPHKPLLVLYAIGRLLQGEERLLPYAEVDKELGNLLQEFGPKRQNYQTGLTQDVGGRGRVLSRFFALGDWSRGAVDSGQWLVTASVDR